MREPKSRIVKAWVLLSIYIATMTLAVVHHHEATPTYDDGCMECTHQVHHFHMSTDNVGIHECLLCKFVSLNYTVAPAITLALPTVHKRITARLLPQPLCRQASSNLCTRAPPCFENLLERNTIYLLN